MLPLEYLDKIGQQWNFGNKVFSSFGFRHSCYSDSSSHEFEASSLQPCLAAKGVELQRRAKSLLQQG
jgi:hypothetical protein